MFGIKNHLIKPGTLMVTELNHTKPQNSQNHGFDQIATSVGALIICIIRQTNRNTANQTNKLNK